MMEWLKITSFSTNGDFNSFLKASELIIAKPQVLSRRFAGAEILFSYYTDNDSFLQIFNFPNQLVKLQDELQTKLEITSGMKTDCIRVLKECIDGLICLSERKGCGTNVSVLLQLCIPKSSFYKKSFNLVLRDDRRMLQIPIASGTETTAVNKLELVQMYLMEESNEGNTVSLYLLSCNSENTTLQESWFERFLHYCNTDIVDTENRSLKLVNILEYTDLYNRLKKDYGLFLISNWTERTDPEKFVYEDIAIAAYLILIFVQERKAKKLISKQSFLDIGCGNGLLVYLLTKEGYPGTGVDIRKRKIWDWFDGVDLQERTISPSAEVLFPEYDWLIGNHSDEMTPWIPVMSARSKFNASFFVLPCCPFDFDGKFRERKAQLSVYQAYLDYMEDLVEICGFVSERDMLKIPSTKRTCIIGRVRNYKVEEETVIDARRIEFIKNRSYLMQGGAKPPENSTPDTWSNFIPREKEEKVRNCTQLDLSLKLKIVETVFDLILKTENYIIINDKKWNRGGSIPIGDLVQNFNKETLKQLKNECGGLQTLLKNHHQMFLIVKGCVELRSSSVQSRKQDRNSQKDVYFKSSLCWFYDHHPDGCWQTADQCTYAHGTNELRTPVKNE